MKRIIAYYSLSGNTEEVTKNIAEKLGCDVLRIETAKAMPKSYAAQIVVGGGQVMMGVVPDIKPLDVDISDYDEIFVATPVWNGKCVPAINTFLKIAPKEKVKGAIITSISGDVDKCIVDLETRLSSLKYTVSLFDKKQKNSSENQERIENFIQSIED